MPEKELASWLLAKRSQGWQLVGLEQTTCSVSLPAFRYAPATVLVVGREREGIPEHILQVRSEDIWWACKCFHLVLASWL